jgi:hypothetical protein
MVRLGRHTSLFVPLALLASCSSLIGLDDLEPDDDERAGAGGGLIGPMTGGAGGTSNGGSGGEAGDGGSGAKPPKAQGGEGGEGNAGNAGEAGATGDAGMGGGGSGGGANGCTEIVAGTYWGPFIDLEFEMSAYQFVVSPDIAGAGPDYLAVEFYWFGDLDGDAPGVFQIEGSSDADYATCSRCVLVQDQSETYYLAASGTIVVDQDSDHVHGYPQVVLTDITLIEVTINADTFLSTPVPNGKCLHLESLVLDDSLTPEGPPASWDCSPIYYLDGSCDCGCGVVDADCESPTAECDYDWCGASAAPDPTDNSQCIDL